MKVGVFVLNSNDVSGSLQKHYWIIRLGGGEWLLHLILALTRHHFLSKALFWVQTNNCALDPAPIETDGRLLIEESRWQDGEPAWIHSTWKDVV